MTEKNQNITPMWKDLMHNVDLDDFTSFLDHRYLTYISAWMQIEWRKFIEQNLKNVWITVSAGSAEKFTEQSNTHAQTILKNTFSDTAIW